MQIYLTTTTTKSQYLHREFYTNFMFCQNYGFFPSVDRLYLYYFYFIEPEIWYTLSKTTSVTLYIKYIVKCYLATTHTLYRLLNDGRDIWSLWYWTLELLLLNNEYLVDCLKPISHWEYHMVFIISFITFCTTNYHLSMQSRDTLLSPILDIKEIHCFLLFLLYKWRKHMQIVRNWIIFKQKNFK